MTVYTHTFEIDFLHKKIEGEVVFDSGQLPAIHMTTLVEMTVNELMYFHTVIDALVNLYKTSGGFTKFEVNSK
jgi:hypothetical protein